MRVTWKVRNTRGVQNALGVKDKRIVAALKQNSEASMERVYARAQELCPRESGYAAEHMRKKLTRDGLNYEIGWHASDFVGTTRVRNGRSEPRPFYVPYFVFLHGLDPLHPAMQEDIPQYLAGARKALRGG